MTQTIWSPICVIGNSGQEAEESEALSRQFFSDPNWIHYIAMLQRPGVADCFMTLEDQHYAPGSERNHFFQVRMLRWQELIWFIASIPSTDCAHMQQAALAHGLRVVPGVPRLITSEGTYSFPIDQPNAYTLENRPGHPVYKNRGC